MPQIITPQYIDIALFAKNVLYIFENTHKNIYIDCADKNYVAISGMLETTVGGSFRKHGTKKAIIEKIGVHTRIIILRNGGNDNPISPVTEYANDKDAVVFRIPVETIMLTLNKCEIEDGVAFYDLIQRIYAL